MIRSAFLSYNSLDEVLAKTLVKQLEHHGATIWFAPYAIFGGEFYADKIPGAIRDHDVFLLLASAQSIGLASDGSPGSRGVLRELQQADNQQKKIIPLVVDDALPQGCHDAFSFLLCSCQYIDLRVAVKAARFESACREIFQAIEADEQIHSGRGNNLFSEVEILLKEGNWEAALSGIPRSGLANGDAGRAILLRTIAQLQSRPIRNLDKHNADALVARLRTLHDLDEAPVVLFLLGILSQYFYQVRAMHDETGGLSELKRQARAAGRLPAKYLNMVRPMLPDGSRFELSWKFGPAIQRE